MFTTRTLSRQLPRFTKTILNKRAAYATFNKELISKITEEETKITGSPNPQKGGPTAAAQSHAGQEVTQQAIEDIARATQRLSQNSSSTTKTTQQSTNTSQSTNSSLNTTGSKMMNQDTLHKIAEAEKNITHQDTMVKDGPTAHAQQHANEPITSEVLHDITEGEKHITGGERIKGGPTSVAQSILSKSLQGNSSNQSSNTNANVSNNANSDNNVNNNNNATNNNNANTNNNASTNRANASISGGNGAILDHDALHKIAEAEKEITHQDQMVAGGPTARAQAHANQPITSEVLHDITEGEKNITGGDRVKGGPTSTAQSILSKGQQGNVSNANNNNNNTTNNNNSNTNKANTSASGGNSAILDHDALHKIAEAEKEITHQDQMVAGGPTARAQGHANQPITSEVLHDITEGEKNITGGDRIKGGPTSTAQSILSKGQQGGGPNQSNNTNQSTSSNSGTMASDVVSEISTQ